MNNQEFNAEQIKRIYMCWLPSRQIFVTNNAPYSTGIGICTSTVRCPSWYCPIFFSLIIIFHLATSLRYAHLMSPKRCDTLKDYRYGNRPYDNTGNAIVTHRTIIGMVINKITVPVMPS